MPLLSVCAASAFALFALTACEPAQPAGMLDPATTRAAAADPATGSERTMRLGDTVRLSAPKASRRDKLVLWNSSDPNVASVSQTGVVIARALGHATITCTSRTANLRVLIFVVARTDTTGTDTTKTDTTTVDTTTTPPPPSGPLGVNVALGRRLFPADNPWNQPVDTQPVDANSAAIIASIGSTKSFHPDFGANWNGGPFGIPYVVVSGTQPRVPITFQYDDESDPGPYPIPPNAPIEGGAASSGDRHVLVVDRDNWMLYEVYAAYPQVGGNWTAGSGARFDLNSNALRPAGWTSADAAGLPILPGLVRYEEVAAGAIDHALRFTVSRTRRAYIPPARHWASSDTSSLRPPMGMRVRLKAGFNISSYPPSAQVILRAMKKYGLIVADNGSDWYVSGTADARWNDGELNTLKQLRGSDFEVVQMTGIVKP